MADCLLLYDLHLSADVSVLCRYRYLKGLGKLTPMHLAVQSLDSSMPAYIAGCAKSQGINITWPDQSIMASFLASILDLRGRSQEEEQAFFVMLEESVPGLGSTDVREKMKDPKALAGTAVTAPKKESGMQTHQRAIQVDMEPAQMSIICWAWHQICCRAGH